MLRTIRDDYDFMRLFGKFLMSAAGCMAYFSQYLKLTHDANSSFDRPWTEIFIFIV
jgi:hypothetical protein